MNPRSGGRPRALRVTVVESPACHFCADAHEALEDLSASGHLLQTKTVDVRSDEGRRLMAQHGAAISPLVLVEGRFFSQGRLPRRKLDALVRQQAAAPPAGPV